MRYNLHNSLLSVILTVVSTMVVIGQAQARPPGSMGKGQSIVISLQTSPFFNAEPACVGVQIGINMLMDMGGLVIPAASVTLFPTLQGVDAVSPRMADLTAETAPPELFCTTSAEDTLLTDLIGGFVGMGGKIVVCPLCWKSRYPGQKPLFGAEVGTGISVHNLFLTADKVIDF